MMENKKKLVIEKEECRRTHHKLVTEMLKNLDTTKCELTLSVL